VLYSPPGSTPARRFRGTPRVCILRASIRPNEEARGSRACRVAAERA
jgi:hypothetical protein